MSQQNEIRDPFLVGLSGPLKGKKFKFRSNRIVLGSGKDADITVPGNRVSEVHAVLQKNASGEWELRNKSPQGTLVNKSRADIHSLEPGDTVQIGEQVLFRFDCRKSAFKASSNPPVSSERAAKGSIFQKPAVVIGVVAYLVGMAVMLLMLQDDPTLDSDSGLTAEYVDEALDATANYLRGAIQERGAGSGTSASESTLDSNIERATDYYISIYALQPDARDAAIERLLARLRESFFRAWQYEKRGQANAAVAEYQLIGQMIPDPKAPVNRVALWRLSEIEE